MSADYTTVKVIEPDPTKFPWQAVCLMDGCGWTYLNSSFEDACTGAGEVHAGLSGHRVAVQKLTEAQS